MLSTQIWIPSPAIQSSLLDMQICQNSMNNKTLEISRASHLWWLVSCWKKKIKKDVTWLWNILNESTISTAFVYLAKVQNTTFNRMCYLYVSVWCEHA